MEHEKLHKPAKGRKVANQNEKKGTNVINVQALAEEAAAIEEVKKEIIEIALEACEVASDSYMHMCWTRNYITNSLEGFWENNIGEMNVPERIKNIREEHLKREKEKIDKATVKQVDKNKIAAEANVIILQSRMKGKGRA